LDHFDTIFCNGPNHVEEMRQTEEAYGLPAKKLVPVGFPLFDQMMEAVREQGGLVRNTPPVVLIAPSWQPEGLLELCLADAVTPLVAAGFHVIVRPHPEFSKRFGDKLDAIREQFAEEMQRGDMELQTDFSSSSTVYNADVMITDWSTIAQEFSYVTKKPSIFINTPMKIMNHNYTAIKAPPLDVTLRDQIGVSLDVDELPRIAAVAQEMVDHPSAWSDRISSVVQANLFNIGTSARAGAAYIVGTVAEQRHKRAVLAAERAQSRGIATPDQETLLEGESGRIDKERIEQMRDRARDLEQQAVAMRKEADELELVSGGARG
jgi:YidC/Oxa1 family membrane protein insertase